MVKAEYTVNGGKAAPLSGGGCGRYSGRMSHPITIDLPHSLGAEEAKRRMQNAGGRLADHIPGGGADVQSRWDGDRMYLSVRALGQEVTGHIDVFDSKVRLELMLPGMLGLFGSKIEALLRKKGGELLEDKSGSKPA